MADKVFLFAQKPFIIQHILSHCRVIRYSGVVAMNIETKTKKAFTLIELLVVISVIAILLAILMPALRKARQAAQALTCSAHQRGFGMAFQAYLQDNDFWSHWGPNRGYWELPGSNTMADKNNTDAYWGIAYFEYAGNRDVFHCPSSRFQLQTWHASDNIEIYHWAHFGLNGFVANRKISRIRLPVKTIVIQDHFVLVNLKGQ